jgi:hypothetical protein
LLQLVGKLATSLLGTHLVSGTNFTFYFQVCFKGPNIFKGYLYDDQKTKEAFDEDGWLLSGDIGIWLPNGTLKIVDRRKNIFKLSQVWARYLDDIIFECESFRQYIPVRYIFQVVQTQTTTAYCRILPTLDHHV